MHLKIEKQVVFEGGFSFSQRLLHNLRFENNSKFQDSAKTPCKDNRKQQTQQQSKDEWTEKPLSEDCPWTCEILVFTLNSNQPTKNESFIRKLYSPKILKSRRSFRVSPFVFVDYLLFFHQVFQILRYFSKTRVLESEFCYKNKCVLLENYVCFSHTNTLALENKINNNFLRRKKKTNFQKDFFTFTFF